MPRLRSVRPPRPRPSTPATSPRSAADLAQAGGVEQLDRFVREPEVRRITGLSRTTRWRLAKRGEFPKSLRIAEAASAWRLSDLIAWINSRSTLQEAAQSGTEGDGR